MSNAASFEFRHLHRRIDAGEFIPPLPSLLQQVEALTQEIREARNQPQIEDEDLPELDTFEPLEREEPDD